MCINISKASGKRLQHANAMYCNIVGRDMLCAFGHHVATCCDLLGVVDSNLIIFKLEATKPNMWQRVPTRWLNAQSMLRPTMLRYVGFACCNLWQVSAPGGGGRGVGKGGMCGPFPKTPTLFMTRICEIPYLIHDLTKNSKPYLLPVSVVRYNSSLVQTNVKLL